MIEIKNLSLSFGKGLVVDDFNLTINDGEIIGLVGESGCGKTVTALTVLGLEAKTEQVVSGSITFDDVVLRQAGVKKDEKLIRSYQGDDMSMIFQEPMTSLNPTMKAGLQLDETLRLHTDLDKKSRYDRIIETLKSVGLNDAERVYDSYPHELSGGMRQRVVIALAVILKPKLIVADEPTTALDVTVQKQIVELLKDIRNEQKNSMLFITHDLKLAGTLCDRIVVMKDGKIVEIGPTKELFSNPKEAYSKSLLKAVTNARKESFLDYSSKEEILSVDDLSVYYRNSGNKIFNKGHHPALFNASFNIKKGECVGLVGESGCGKTTLAKAILGINKDITGTLKLNTTYPQLVFQDPYSSLNPVKTIGWQLEEPLKALGMIDKSKAYDGETRKNKVIAMLKEVGLSDEYYYRKPNELSGGQRQRVSIAQALITEPEFVIADEPVSALDVTVQAQVMDLLRRLQKERGLSMLFISHDISVVASIADRILVMKSGHVVEFGSTNDVIDSPKEEYTKELMASAIL